MAGPASENLVIAGCSLGSNAWDLWASACLSLTSIVGATPSPLHHTQVCRTESGVLQTISPVLGSGGGPRFYDFFLEPGEELDRLIVTETDAQHENLAVELLDAGDNSACSRWGDVLPRRLRELHSHWLCRDLGAIVVRPPDFRERDTNFLITYSGAGGAEEGNAKADLGSVYNCRRVPSQLRSDHWTSLLGQDQHVLADQLVLLEGCAVSSVLSKFEEPWFIHAHRPLPTSGDMQHRSNLIFELPRLNLEFELSSLDGTVRSRNYAGYRLRQRQQLVSEGADGTVLYTLPEFEHYLVLERDPGSATVVGAQRADLLVLVPAGLSVARRPDGSVVLGVPPASGASIRVNQCFLPGAQLSKCSV